MLESIRRAVTVPRITFAPLIGVVTALAFFWLLALDHIHPLVIYLSQLYLMF